MDRQLWHKVAAISGVVALGLGTYGAHVFKPQDPAYKDVRLAHRIALPLGSHRCLSCRSNYKTPNVFGGLLTAGILAFSGTIHPKFVTEQLDHCPVQILNIVNLLPFVLPMVHDLEISVFSDDVPDRLKFFC
ncbi:hypothetical protein E2542_SST21430 [Spatholobus suberectus]|nr:hypothetical protein E2542_SST21430 [Spatholobus suberectus]